MRNKYDHNRWLCKPWLIMKCWRKILWINRGLVWLCERTDIFKFLYFFDLGLHTVLLLGVTASATFSNMYFRYFKLPLTQYQKLKVNSTKTSYIRYIKICTFILKLDSDFSSGLNTGIRVHNMAYVCGKFIPKDFVFNPKIDLSHICLS